MSAIHVLLRNSIDYAGLFPPAGLDMGAAAANYARYRGGEAAWALGRFILPVSRLAEFGSVSEELLPVYPAVQPWQLSVLTGPEIAGDLDQVAAFNQGHALPGSGAARIDTLELKASSADAIEDTMHRVPRHLQVYFEIPIDEDPSGLLGSIGRLGARAKVRTGGVTAEAFPTTAELLRFLSACVRARVPFKATAGLHHPLRAEYRLTYAPDSATGTMFGFLNLFLATAFLRAGMREDEAARILEETSSAALQVSDSGIAWKQHRLDIDALRGTREELIASFGSCSFVEPIDELETLHLLEPRVQQA